MEMWWSVVTKTEFNILTYNQYKNIVFFKKYWYILHKVIIKISVVAKHKINSSAEYKLLSFVERIMNKYKKLKRASNGKKHGNK